MAGVAARRRSRLAGNWIAFAPPEPRGPALSIAAVGPRPDAGFAGLRRKLRRQRYFLKESTLIVGVLVVTSKRRRTRYPGRVELNVVIAQHL